MSIDGPGLYQDDTGHDVRSEAIELAAQGLRPPDITSTLVARFLDVLGDEDTYCAFYLALADTQWRLNRLDPEVKRIAIDLIQSGRDLRRWEHSESFHARRKAVLTKLATKLATPTGPERKVNAPRRYRTSLVVGDVFVHAAATGERFLMHVVGLSENGGRLNATIQILDWDWQEEPTPDAVALARPVTPAGHLQNRMHLQFYRGTDMPKKQVTYLGTWKPQRADARPEIGGVVAFAGPYLDRIARTIVNGGSGAA